MTVFLMEEWPGLSCGYSCRFSAVNRFFINYRAIIIGMLIIIFGDSFAFWVLRAGKVGVQGLNVVVY